MRVRKFPYRFGEGKKGFNPVDNKNQIIFSSVLFFYQQKQQY
jgi:hypothetical protein